eukprot:ANDGO_06996.mRNA.1 putative solute carrier family 35 member C320.08
MLLRKMRIQKESVISALLGQFLSLMIVGTGVFSTYLADKGVVIPTTQSFFLYFLLAVVYGSWFFLYKKQKLQLAWYKYVPMALADVEANYFVVKAYAYTSIVSIMLLDCLTIPFVMILSVMFLKTKYSWKHLLVVLYTISGAILLVFTDFMDENGDESNSSDAWIGDLLCVASSLCYAISNVFQESVVKEYERSEFLSMIGAFGSVISICQIAILEREGLSIFVSGTWMLILGFVFCMFMLYSFAPVLIQMESATFFNLSLLTADALALVVGIFLFDDRLSNLFWLAMAIILSGITLYNLLPEVKPKEPRRELMIDDDDAWANEDENADIRLIPHGDSASSVLSDDA